MFKKSFQKIFLTAAVGILLLAPAALAAGILPGESGTAKPEAVAACKKINPNGSCGNYSLNDIVQLIINVSDWILGVVGSVALLFFVYGGFVFIFSGGSEEKVKQGKQILIGSIIGLFIVFGSFLIIKYSEKFLGTQYTNDKTLQINVPK
jgi:hypothetical protein